MITLKTFEVNQNKFTVPDYYKIIGIIGQGAYGVVAFVERFFEPPTFFEIFWSAAENTKTGEKVAIKKIFDVFEKDREYQKRILREVKILKHFRDHENVCRSYLIFKVSFYHSVRLYA